MLKARLQELHVRGRKKPTELQEQLDDSLNRLSPQHVPRKPVHKTVRGKKKLPKNEVRQQLGNTLNSLLLLAPKRKPVPRRRAPPVAFKEPELTPLRRVLPPVPAFNETRKVAPKGYASSNVSSSESPRRFTKNVRNYASSNVDSSLNRPRKVAPLDYASSNVNEPRDRKAKRKSTRRPNSGSSHVSEDSGSSNISGSSSNMRRRA